MSGVLLAWRGVETSEWGAKLSFSPHSRSLPIDWVPWSGSLVRIEAEGRWEPVFDSESGISVAIIGRVAWRRDQWQEAQTLAAGCAGSAAQLLLHRWKRGQVQFLDLLNGPAVVFVHDARQQKLHLFTDRLGVFPLFLSGDRHPVICSHPDVLADWRLSMGLPVTLDEDSIAEVLVTGCATTPYTFYQEIQCLQPATHYQFKQQGEGVCIEKSTYWQPSSEPAQVQDANYWIDRTADAICEAVTKRTHPEAGKVGVFLSGGSDSRAMLYAARNASELTTITFADAINPESEIAERIAQLTGTSHYLLLRDSEQYGNTAREGVRISGGNWSIQDNHYHGLFPEIDKLSLDSILTGDYADLMLKGLTLNREELHIGRHHFGADRLMPFGFEFYQPHLQVAPAWNQRVAQRLEARFPLGIRANRHLVEDLRVRPLGRNSDSMGDSWLLRMLPWDPPFTDNAIVDVFDQMPTSLKLNNRVYGRAVNRLATGEQRRIPHSLHGCAVDASIVAIVARGLISRFTSRLAGKKENESIVTNGSWPNFAYYIANSTVIAGLWRDPSSQTQELLTQILGENPWAKPLSWWGSGSYHSEQLFLRLLTSKLWLETRGL